MKSEMNYRDALLKVDAIIKELESPDVDMAKVKEKVLSAVELLKFCKAELAGYKEEFSKILSEDKDEE